MLVLTGFVFVGASAPLQGQSPLDGRTVYGELMCMCGCNQLLGTCSMVACPNRGPMRAEVIAYLEQGMDLEEILAAFQDKYGPAVLASPPTSGWFNISGWVMPFVALLVGLGGLTFYLRHVRRHSTPSEAIAAGSGAGDYRQRLEEELADFIPED